VSVFSWLLWAPVLATEAHFRRKQLHLIGLTELANHQWRKPEPLDPPRRWGQSLVSSSGNVCVRVYVVCVCVCVREEAHGPFHLRWPLWMEGRGCGFSEVSVSRREERPTPLLLSSRFVPPHVSHCWASWGRRRRCWSGRWAVVPARKNQNV